MATLGTYYGDTDERSCLTIRGFTFYKRLPLHGVLVLNSPFLLARRADVIQSRYNANFNQRSNKC